MCYYFTWYEIFSNGVFISRFDDLMNNLSLSPLYNKVYNTHIDFTNKSVIEFKSKGKDLLVESMI